MSASTTRRASFSGARWRCTAGPSTRLISTARRRRLDAEAPQAGRLLQAPSFESFREPGFDFLRVVVERAGSSLVENDTVLDDVEPLGPPGVELVRWVFDWVDEE